MTKRSLKKPIKLPSANSGGGLLDRRSFLILAGAGLTAPWVSSHGASAHAASARAGSPILAPSMGIAGGEFRNYGMPSPYEKEVIRWISHNRDVPGHGVSWTPLQQLEGILTPNGLHFERHHNGVPDIDPEQHQLLIHGQVRQPRIYDMNQLMRYGRRSRLCFVECGGNSNAGWNPTPIQAPLGMFHGLASCSEWSGIPLAALLDEVGLDEVGVKNRSETSLWIDAEGADGGGFHVSIPMDKALDDAILALYQNGERLRPENGYPMRLILPGFEAVTHVKWLRRLKIVEKPVMSRDETARYTELMPNGKSRQFTFIMHPKSLILRPSYGMNMQGEGIYEISGLAWSGFGRVRQVEVSADGGKSWAKADLEEPVQPCAFTRFRIPWHWHGQPAILKSRVTDEKGHRQPERADLLKRRGRFGYFHYHAILSWQIDSDGRIRHVYA